MASTIIIAEAGINHNGSVENAFKLIDAAADAQADYVKFQTFNAGRLVSSSAPKAEYQKKNTDDGSQLDMLKKLELSKEQLIEIKNYSKKRGIGFLSTGFDEESVDLLYDLNIPFFKIPSGEITNKPLLKHIAEKKKHVILSTGMATLEEISAAISVLCKNGLQKEQITVLHCSTEYPAPMEEVNLLAMLQIRDKLNVEIGYSDHTEGIEVPIAAVVLGAKIIEKHFTLSRDMPGPDHKASLEPNELKEMVKAIRNIEKALSGSGIKEPGKSETKNIVIARKSIHLNKNLKKDDIIREEDLIMKRPGNGISPMEIENVIGKVVNKDLEHDVMLRWQDVD